MEEAGLGHVIGGEERLHQVVGLLGVVQRGVVILEEQVQIGLEDVVPEDADGVAALLQVLDDLVLVEGVVAEREPVVGEPAEAGVELVREQHCVIAQGVPGPLEEAGELLDFAADLPGRHAAEAEVVRVVEGHPPAVDDVAGFQAGLIGLLEMGQGLLERAPPVLDEDAEDEVDLAANLLVLQPRVELDAQLAVFEAGLVVAKRRAQHHAPERVGVGGDVGIAVLERDVDHLERHHGHQLAVAQVIGGRDDAHQHPHHGALLRIRQLGRVNQRGNAAARQIFLRERHLGHQRLDLGAELHVHTEQAQAGQTHVRGLDQLAEVGVGGGLDAGERGLVQAVARPGGDTLHELVRNLGMGAEELALNAVLVEAEGHLVIPLPVVDRQPVGGQRQVPERGFVGGGLLGLAAGDQVEADQLLALAHLGDEVAARVEMPCDFKDPTRQSGFRGVPAQQAADVQVQRRPFRLGHERVSRLLHAIVDELALHLRLRGLLGRELRKVA